MNVYVLMFAMKYYKAIDEIMKKKVKRKMNDVVNRIFD